jgi:hypothetical protein
MWSRAKREGRGEKLDPQVWSASVQNATREVGQADMDEMVEIGYGSDREEVNGDVKIKPQ